MSLSQKYSGKVLVPWFNTSEWQSVFNLLQSASDDAHTAALEMLRIWKTRTPLLSAGIEGTLILLEALSSTQTLSESQIIQMYSIALMRFLNICAANNERQGTFSQSISKTDLPKWLIDIRHDIAHHNKMPSKSLLEIGLKQSFDWLIDKYWKVQRNRICDFTVTEFSENESGELMQAYVRLSTIEDGQAPDEATMNSIKKLIGNRSLQSDNDIDSLLRNLEDMLNRFFGEKSNSGKLQTQLKTLVSENAMLGVKLEVSSEGRDQMVSESRDLWSNILNLLFNHGLLFKLLHELYKVTCDALQKDSLKIVAALWIEEILEGLSELEAVKMKLLELSKGEVMKTKSPRVIARAHAEKENESFKNCLKFEETTIDSSNNAREFRDILLSIPNVHTSRLLNCLTNVSRESPDSWSKLADMYLEPLTNMWEDEIMTANHIDGLLGSFQAHHGIDQPRGVNLHSDTQIFSNLTISNKWEKIQDTRPFQRCPLGLLPHQSNVTNPTILI